VKDGVKVTLILGLLTLVLPITHNMIYALFGVEEGLFILLSIAAFVLFQVTALKSFFGYKKTGEPKDLWKLGFLGLLGPIYVFVFHLPLGFLGFLGFFGYFSFYKKKKKVSRKAGF
jgi:hypothetical protein